MSVVIEPFVFINEAWKYGEDGITREQYTEIVLVLNVLKKWEWIMEIELFRGFQFTTDPYFNLITSSINLSDHTGHTLEYMFRKIKRIACNLIERKVQMCTVCSLEDAGIFVMFDCGHKFHIECCCNMTCPLLCENNIFPFESS